MYYTEIDPRTMKPVYVAKTAEEKAMQRALLQWRRPDKRPIVLAALKKAGREDLIGFGKECLIRPARGEKPPVSSSRTAKSAKNARPTAHRPAAPKKRGWAKAKRKK